MKKLRSGFTLIELLLVLAIMAVLTSIVLANLSKASNTAYNNKVITDVRQIQFGLQLYYQDHGAFPSCPNPSGGTGSQACCVGTTKCYLAGTEYTVDLSTLTSSLNKEKIDSSQLAGTYFPFFGSSAHPVKDANQLLNGPYVYICSGLNSATLCPPSKAAISYTLSSGTVVVIPAGDVDAVFIPSSDTVVGGGTPNGGCTDPSAVNYSSTASFNDGSCSYTGHEGTGGVYGCTNNTALNFTALSTIDNGSCRYSTDPSSCGFYLEGVRKGFYNCGHGWNSTGIHGCGHFYDSNQILQSNEPAVCGYGWSEVGSGSGGDYNDILGCTDPQAINFNSSATVYDGSCQYGGNSEFGCTDPAATNYSNVAIYDNGSCTYSDGSHGSDDSDTGPVGGCTNNSAINYNSSATFNNGSCQFSAQPYGCGFYLESSYKGTYNCGNGWNSTGAYGCGNYYDGVYYPTYTCGPGWGNNTPAVSGCTDPSANNYNPNATLDDGSCTFAANIYGCMQDTAVNFNPNATIDDGSCYGGYGCTDPTATNYNPGATMDDKSCTYPYRGCTDPSANNFDTVATIDDCSCRYGDSNSLTPYCESQLVYGCTNPSANNYNPNATADNGSCTYGGGGGIVRGCRDPLAFNFNPDATIDDGSCTYTNNGTCTLPQASNYNPNATVSNNSTCLRNGLRCGDPRALNNSGLEQGGCIFDPDNNVGPLGSADGPEVGCGYYLYADYMPPYSCGPGRD